MIKSLILKKEKLVRFGIVCVEDYVQQRWISALAHIRQVNQTGKPGLQQTRFSLGFKAIRANKLYDLFNGRLPSIAQIGAIISQILQGLQKAGEVSALGLSCHEIFESRLPEPDVALPCEISAVELIVVGKSVRIGKQRINYSVNQYASRILGCQ